MRNVICLFMICITFGSQKGASIEKLWMDALHREEVVFSTIRAKCLHCLQLLKMSSILFALLTACIHYRQLILTQIFIIKRIKLCTLRYRNIRNLFRKSVCSESSIPWKGQCVALRVSVIFESAI